MIFLLPLIILAAANPCPYCRYDQCTYTEGSYGSCNECYSMAARLNMEVPASDTNAAIQNIGICQLCPDHCNSCEYAMLSPSHSTPIHTLNCTDCQEGYINSYFNGTCLACPDNCESCYCIFNACSAVYCETCDEGYETYRNTETYTI